MKRGWKMGEDKSKALLPFLFIEKVETGGNGRDKRGMISKYHTS